MTEADTQREAVLAALGRVEDAIPEVLAGFKSDRAFVLEDIVAIPSVVEGLVRIDLTHVHVGTLGLHVRQKRHTVINPEDADNARGILLDTVRSIRADIDDQVDFASIGCTAHHLDPVLARMLASDPIGTIHAINGSIIDDALDGSELLEGQVYKRVDFADTDAILDIVLQLDDGIIWRPDLAAIEFEDLPDTVQAALAGRPLSDLVTHPLLPEHIVISEVDDAEGGVFVHYVPEHVPLAPILGPWPPAPDNPMGLEQPCWLDGMPIEFESL